MVRAVGQPGSLEMATLVSRAGWLCLEPWARQQTQRGRAVVLERCKAVCRTPRTGSGSRSVGGETKTFFIATKAGGTEAPRWYTSLKTKSS